MKLNMVLTLIFLAISTASGCGGDSVSSTNKGPDKQSLSTPESTANTIASDSSRSNSVSNSVNSGSGNSNTAGSTNSNIASTSDRSANGINK